MTPFARESCVLQFLSLRIPVVPQIPHSFAVYRREFHVHWGSIHCAVGTIERAVRMIFYLISWDVLTHIVNCDWKFCQLNFNSVSATQHSFQDRFKSLIYLSVTSLDLLQKNEVWWDASRMHFRH
ncbi:hypothetical protein AC1031_007951 [Aphanomyces cochlioides]|nr:hypothetical protein AC1031_007951 [Aphanomyces cochlioides]